MCFHSLFRIWLKEKVYSGNGKKYNFFSCGINLNLFSNSVVNQFVENEIQVTVYADNNISKVEAHNLWNNNVTSIFIDDPTEYI